MRKSVLLVGGYGVLGDALAKALRSRNPDLHITVAGRSPLRAKALAAYLGNAEGVAFDLDDPSARFPVGNWSAIAVLVKDYRLSFTDRARMHASPLLSLSSGAFEIGPEMFHGLRAAAAPIILASHWLAGGPVLAALELALRLDSVIEIDVGLFIDRSGGPSGPATTADFERISTACPSTLVRRGGRYEWVRGDAARACFERENGAPAEGSIAVSCDVMSLASATGAASVHVVEAFGQSLSAARGDGPADEISVRVSGIAADGTARELRRFLTAPRAPYGLTAITATLAIERMAGLRGDAALAPGLYPVDAIIDPISFLEAIEAMGVTMSPVREMIRWPASGRKFS